MLPWTLSSDGQAEALQVVAHEEAAHHQLAGLINADHRQYVNDGNIAKKLIGGAIQDPPHRIVHSAP